MLQGFFFHRGWRKQVFAQHFIGMKERNREFTLNTISFGLSNARIEQDQAPHNAKLMVQERGINAYHGLSQLLQPENPSSKEAFLEAIAV